ncbi:MmcQ/YjbR family DNA-binding protein [Vagococcus hydrophili]|uniref:MmcQ/YjbR family DNA-binding protein n=2 Tax=Vagococcus hydrophili TaxID=2714947 RepID=A0A6G8AXK2_9ENTE|nr:MmcQ/YjbR family DNA-binding protein [Vagococcus hydrophili]
MKRFEEFGNQLPHGKVYYREDWDCIYFDLLGKQFGMMSKNADEDSLITLKGEPEVNEVLRETYEDVVPGYYANKKHWNSIYLKSTEISDEEIKRMIQTSYELVWKKLPAKVRKELSEQ